MLWGRLEGGGCELAFVTELGELLHGDVLRADELVIVVWVVKREGVLSSVVRLRSGGWFMPAFVLGETVGDGSTTIKRALETLSLSGTTGCDKRVLFSREQSSPSWDGTPIR